MKYQNLYQLGFAVDFGFEFWFLSKANFWFQFGFWFWEQFQFCFWFFLFFSFFKILFYFILTKILNQ
jgi:hypothetical protein